MSIESLKTLPDGAVSVTTRDGKLLLQASHTLQEKFEKLLVRLKADQLTPEEVTEYEAICELDNALSWLNRELRRTAH